ncbi:hypothetical protein BN946_scf185008.g46 [Trametes cinnabarina]|uniref:Zn(2)-C6 fungal-type domain-containing protein n=1 Tax=Pycnoporus cinnabarinus TaxID=5643 RepID=A0A060SM53_PYCCI|nr:hypothetical protein BN946_scf185008.g46 [Trametes cinnabarina]
MSSPPDPQQPFSVSNLATTAKLSPQSPPYSAPLDHSRIPETEHVSVAFVKGAKRKRLSKACDACHKSKRRCDGTAPCSNCYYASKNCTYTDAAGRPVPAPRNSNPERPLTAAITTASPTSEPLPWAGQATAAAPSAGAPPSGIERDPSSKRSRRDQPGSSESPTSASKSDGPLESYASPLLDPVTTHELVQIFFAHCNPQRMVIHKPSFSSDLSLNRVPTHLLLAVCALAAPLHKSVASKASQARLAGVPYFQEALSVMFDNSGRLLCEPSVSTAQALCLLEMHEVAASHSWTRHFRYFGGSFIFLRSGEQWALIASRLPSSASRGSCSLECVTMAYVLIHIDAELALQVLEGSLEAHLADNAAPPSPTDADGLIRFIEGECTRRCFWLIQTLAWISNIYTRKPILPRMAELADVVRLPIDETTFELAVLSSSATSEYLRRPAPRTRYASQWGHMCRILEISHNVETILATKEGPDRVYAIQAVKPALVAWFQSLPSHLQFNEENLETQVAMFETGSNSGAWCYCFMHAIHASRAPEPPACVGLRLSACAPACALNGKDANRALFVVQGEGTLTDPIPWVREQLNMIFNAAGTRAKNSILCTYRFRLAAPRDSPFSPSPTLFPHAAGTL